MALAPPLVAVDFTRLKRADGSLVGSEKKIIATPTVGRVTKAADRGFFDLRASVEAASGSADLSGVLLLDATDQHDETWGWKVTIEGEAGSRLVTVPAVGQGGRTKTVNGTSYPAAYLTSLAIFTGPAAGGGGSVDLSNYDTKAQSNDRIAAAIAALRGESDPFTQYASLDELAALPFRADNVSTSGAASGGLSALVKGTDGSYSMATLPRSFPPRPLPANAAQVAAVQVAENQATLPHTMNDGTAIDFTTVGDGNWEGYFGGGGKYYQEGIFFGNQVVIPGTSKDSIGVSQVQFRCVTNSSWLMLRGFNSFGGGYDGRIQVRVNGVVIHPRPITYPGSNAGQWAGIHLGFRDGSYKTVEIFTSWALRSVNVAAGSAIAPLTPPVALKKLYLLGDSWTGGTDQADPIGSYARFMQYATAWDVSANGQGGTGYVQGTSNAYQAIFGSALRRAAIVAAAPDLLCILGSINDINGSGGAQAGVQTAAATLYAQMKTALPTMKILAIGPQYPQPGVAAVGAAIKAAAQAADNVIAYVDPLAEGWNQPGVTGPTDGIHPSILGAEWIADRVASVVRRETVKAGDRSW